LKVDSNTTTINQMKRLEQQKKNLIKAHENEIQNLQNFHADRTNQLKSDSKIDLAQAREQNHQELLDLVDQHKQTLEKKLDELGKQDAFLERERTDLAGQHKEQLLDMNKKFKGNLEERQRKQLAEEQTQNDLTVLGIKNSRNKLNQEIQGSHQRYVEEMSNSTKGHGINLQKQNNLQNLDLRTKEVEHSRKMSELRGKYQQQLLDEELKSENKLMHEKGLGEKQYQVTAGQNQAKLAQEKETFEKRYNEMVKNHENLLQLVKGRLDNEILSTSQKLTGNKGDFATKAADPFYRTSLLTPKIEDGVSNYLIKIKVPEHEKEFLTLNANGRELKLNMTRHHKSETTLEDGSFNKSKRSEIFTKEFSVPDIVDARSITQKYENGEVIFKIKKA